MLCDYSDTLHPSYCYPTIKGYIIVNVSFMSQQTFAAFMGLPMLELLAVDAYLPCGFSHVVHYSLVRTSLNFKEPCKIERTVPKFINSIS